MISDHPGQDMSPEQSGPIPLDSESSSAEFASVEAENFDANLSSQQSDVLRPNSPKVKVEPEMRSPEHVPLSRVPSETSGSIPGRRRSRSNSQKKDEEKVQLALSMKDLERCSMCREYFLTDVFTQHSSKIHNSTCLFEECSCVFITVVSMLIHVNKEHPSVNVKSKVRFCDICECYIDIKSAGTHMKNGHSLKCPHCTLRFPSKHSYIQHIASILPLDVERTDGAEQTGRGGENSRTVETERNLVRLKIKKKEVLKKKVLKEEVLKEKVLKEKVIKEEVIKEEVIKKEVRKKAVKKDLKRKEAVKKEKKKDPFVIELNPPQKKVIFIH